MDKKLVFAMILTFTLFAVIAYCFAIIRNSEHPFAWAAGVGCVALVLALTDSENKENTKYRNKEDDEEDS